MPRRYLIIGPGAAGIAAAETIREHDAVGDILLIGEEPHHPYSRPGLAYYLTGELTERQLYLAMAQRFRRIQARVVALHPKEHQVTLNNGTRQPYDRLLIATGSTAVSLPIPGINLVGVVKLDNMDDARHILKLARRAKEAVVVGGGITALEIVEGLVARGLKTHYLLRRDRYWGNVLDETESAIVEQRLKEEGVQIHYHTQVSQILGKRNRVVGVQTQNGQRLKCGLVAIAVGVRPRKELAEAAGLQTDRGILVNEYLSPKGRDTQTTAPDIFAAGDVAQVFDPFSGQTVLDTLWGVAIAQGRIAGQNMTGHSVPYRKAVPFNVTRLAGLTTTIIGTVGSGTDEDLLSIARGDSETWRQPPDAIMAQSEFKINRLRLVVGQRTLRGAIVMGDQTLSRPLHHLIAHQANITSIRQQLLQPHAPLADLIADLWTTWRNQHAVQQS